MAAAMVGVTTPYYEGNYFERAIGIAHTNYFHDAICVAMRQGDPMF